MQFKLDENLDARLAHLLRDAGQTATTVHEQAIRGIADPDLYQHCMESGAVLVTQDKDFGDVVRYPPRPTPGIIVLRGPNNLFSTTHSLMKTLVQALAREEPNSRLWIVELGRLRIHEPSDQVEGTGQSGATDGPSCPSERVAATSFAA